MNPLEAYLTGRIALRNHVPFPAGAIDENIRSGAIRVIHGIQNRQCMRCLEKSPLAIYAFHCAACQKECLYCRHCITMGRVSSCTDLITWITPSPILQLTHTVAWNGILTPHQQQASDELLSSIQQNNDHLIYAVCGAGKTELLFKPIHHALESGKRVCLAAPRTDVILELSPRLQAAFPDTVIHSLYGGAPHSEGFAQLVLATTHQLYRFQHAFDVMIVDEADAFPYSVDDALKRAVAKAKKADAPTVYVSATPSRNLLKTVKNQSHLFRRYHGHPLPEPKFGALWSYEKAFRKKRIPPLLKRFVEEKLSKNQPFLLFFPTIKLLTETEELFKTLHPNITAVHASDPDRKEKVTKLRNGEIPGVLTSTILERGITLPNVQAAVIGADEPVFTSAALIQIAGRVGRSADYPKGDVFFFHNGITASMDEARRLIRSYNRGGAR